MPTSAGLRVPPWMMPVPRPIVSVLPASQASGVMPS